MLSLAVGPVLALGRDEADAVALFLKLGDVKVFQRPFLPSGFLTYK